jgi:hypothetical protein
MGVVLNSILPPLAVIQPRGFESILLGVFQVEAVYIKALQFFCPCFWERRQESQKLHVNYDSIELVAKNFFTSEGSEVEIIYSFQFKDTQEA